MITRTMNRTEHNCRGTFVGARVRLRERRLTRRSALAPDASPNCGPVLSPLEPLSPEHQQTVPGFRRQWAKDRSPTNAELRERSGPEPEMMLQAIVDACASNVAVLDHSGIIVQVNKAWRSFADRHGLRAAAYGVGLNYLEICRDLWGASVETEGLRRMLAGQATEFTQEYPWHSLATERWFMLHAGRLDLPGPSDNFRILISHEDITSTKREQEGLRTSEERLRRLLNTTHILPWEAESENWRFTYIEEQAINLLGYPAERWHEPDFWVTHLHADDLGPATALRRKYAEMLDHYEIEYRMIAADGRVVWIQDLVSVIRQDGRAKTLRGFMIDITERKQTEAALLDLGTRLIGAQEEERRRVARELHDDLNQRMALLSIDLEQLAQDLPRGQNHLRTRLKNLWANAQEISAEIHRVSYQLHPSKLDHLGLAAAVKSFCQELAGRHKIKVKFQCQGLPAILPKEMTLCLFRIVQESLNNVIKHSGSPEAEVVLESTGQSIRLSVSDGGCGFDLEASRVHRGLGLISMQERLRGIGGELTIHSQPSRGTRIEVSVPLSEAAPQLSVDDHLPKPGSGNLETDFPAPGSANEFPLTESKWSAYETRANHLGR